MECFTVYSDEIGKRIDPLYLKNIHLIKNVDTKFPLVALGDLLKDKVQYGANEEAIDGDIKTDIRYIRITDIDEFGNLKVAEWKTAKNIDEKYLLEEDDILFARSGATAGKPFIYKKEFGKSIFAGYLIRFKIDEKKANPKFIFFYTQLKRYNTWVKSIQRPAGQPNINSEEFKSFEIPLPPLEIQNRIVKIMQSAYHQRNQKLEEANNLLNSINDYVLGELGIKLAEAEDKKCFTVYINEIEERLDPYYNSPKFKDMIKIHLTNKNIKLVEFREIIDLITKGETPLWRGDAYLSEGIPFLKAQNISLDGIKGDINYISEKVHNRMKRSQLSGGELLYTMAGSIGTSTIFPSNFGKANINQAIAKIIIKKGLNKDYFNIILNSKYCKIQAHKFLTISAQPNINFEQIKSLKIPMPCLDIQNKIVKEIKSRVGKVNKFRMDAENIFKEAKSKFENIILGKA